MFRFLKDFARNPKSLVQEINKIPEHCKANNFSHAYIENNKEPETHNTQLLNPLFEYFQKHKDGPGIWKWEHYFDVYHRHFARFIGQKINVLEIGIYSGGSLGMWQTYFGDKCHIYGVDIQEACKAYESDRVSVIIGDQSDRKFWKSFRENVNGLDILIDDGGHTPEQQRITLEEMLPHLSPGGVYICEDIHGRSNRFSAFASGLVHELNGMNRMPGALLQSNVTQFQSAIHSIHFYPYLLVIEKHRTPLKQLSAPKHGTEWQPFL